MDLIKGFYGQKNLLPILSRATCQYGLACSAVLPLDSYPVSPEQAAESFYRRFC
jgi:hypothetical protein